MLSGPEILRQVKLGAIKIEPFDEANLGPNGVDLRLSDRLKVYGDDDDASRLSSPDVRTCEDRGEVALCGHHVFRRVLDMRRENPTAEILIPPDGLVLLPGELYLGSTVEVVGSTRFVPMLETRSSVARLGCSSHLSAGFCDLGFCSTITLEITVAHPLRVYPGVRFCQVAFHEAAGEVKLYQGKYASQSGPTASKMWQDFVGVFGDKTGGVSGHNPL